MNNITIEQFGKDHWSLLAYIQTRIMDYRGSLDPYHLRDKKREGWTPGYGTRLFGYWNKDETTNKDLLILNHDDYDCLDDLEKAGLVKNINTGLFPICELTLNGIEILSLLSLHKQKGKNFFEFVYTCNG